MKEAAGEANLTVVAIILIAVVVAVATPLINSLMRSSSWKSCCTDSGGMVNGKQCQYLTGADTTSKGPGFADCCADQKGGSGTADGSKAYTACKNRAKTRT